MLFPSSTNVVPVHQPDGADVAGLHIRRDALSEERTRLVKIDATVVGAEEVIAQLDSELREITTRERDDIERWADQGALGDPPALLVHERQKLERARAIAAADLRAAVARREGIQKRTSEIDAELTSIGRQLRRHSLSVVLDEMRKLFDEIDGRADALRRPWTRLRALDQVLVTEIARAVARDDRADAEHLAGLKGELDKWPDPNLNWDRASLDAAAAAWLEKIR